MFKDYLEARSWLENFIPQTYTKKELGLERIRHLLGLLGNPQEKFKSIHIAGTSGKGSTAFYTSRLLKIAGPVSLGNSTPQSVPDTEIPSSSGSPLAATRISKIQNPRLPKLGTGGQAKSKILKIGLHISPHLVYIGERMQVNGRPITVSELITLIKEIKPTVESMRGSKVGLPSYFEILVAASFLYFAKKRVDWAVVEVGLGGRLDATNLLKPQICLITNIGLDHRDILGETLEKIAREKAGIIKEKVPVITAANGKALEIIENAAREKKAPLIKVDTQLGVRPLKSDTKDYLVKYYDIDRYIGRHFTFPNLLLALTTVLALGFRPAKKAVEKVSKEIFPGRIEEVEPGVILDGAHNPDKIRYLIDFVRNSKSQTPNSKIILVVGFKKGKDWKKMVDLLIKNLPVTKVIASQFQTPTDTGFFEAVELEEIVKYVKSVYGLQTTVYSNSQEAIFEALNLKSNSPRSKNLVLVTGSLYLAGEARTLWEIPPF